MRIYHILLLILLPFLVKAQAIPQIFVHTDRAAYFPSDTIWFKAYVMNKGLLDRESVNLYLHVGNSEGVIKQQSVLLLKNGMASGFLVVPRASISSNLFINAYTKSIADHPELYSIKAIPLIQENAEIEVNSSQENNINLETYPIGGSIVARIENEILIKTTLSNGKGISTKGRVTDSEEVLNIPFQTDSDGYERIKLNLEPQAAYKIFWNNTDEGNEIMKPLIMHYCSSKATIEEISGDSIKVNVQSNIATEYDLEARINYRQLFQAKLNFSKPGTKSIYIKKTDLEAGTLQVFIRDHSGKLLAKTSYLLASSPEYLLTPEVRFIEKSDQEKGKNTISIMLPTEELAYLSIAISDIQMPPDTSDNIISDLYLKPFLKVKDVDLRKYLAGPNQQEELFQDKIKTLDFVNLDRIPPVKDSLLYLKGHITMDKDSWNKFYERYQKLSSNTKKSKMGARGISFGYKKQADKNMLYTEVTPDEKGWFAIPGMTFYDSLETRFSQIYSDLKFKEYKINYHFSDATIVDQLYVPPMEKQIGTNGLKPNQQYYYGSDYYIDNKGVHHIREVPVFRSKQQKRLDDLEAKYATGFFKSKAEFVFDPHSDEQVIKRSMSLEQYLITNIKRPKFGYIFLNGIQLTDGKIVKELLDTDMSQFIYIKYFDVFPLHSGGYGPATCLYQLAPNEIDREFGKRIDKQTVAGYLGGIKFDNKVYNTILESLISDYDYRPTLYWNPDLELSNEQEITFYNNSRAKGYWITIQGVTQSGKLVFYQQKYFK